MQELQQLSSAVMTVNEDVQITLQDVKRYLVSGDVEVTDKEAIAFLQLCKSHNLNPFLRDAYLIKYGRKPATIVVGKDAFIKRAYEDPNYQGMTAGVVVLKPNGKLEEREGTITLPGEGLVGGWCEVYVKTFKYPVKMTVSYNEYKKDTQIWRQMPGVMIRKCAMVTALREAFPESLQGLYDAAEIQGMPDELSNKPIIKGKATIRQKKKIMEIASKCGLYDFNKPKDVKKLSEWLEEVGYKLTELTYEEAEEATEILQGYENSVNTSIDVDYEEVKEAAETENKEIYVDVKIPDPEGEAVENEKEIVNEVVQEWQKLS